MPTNNRLQNRCLSFFLIVLLGGCEQQVVDPNGKSTTVGFPVAKDINVLVISFDAFRQDNLKAYGNTLNLTPNLDAFAAESTIFLNAYTAGSSTVSSFAAAFTGMYPHRVFRSWKLLQTQTLAKIFAEAGYATGATLNNKQLIAERNFGQGFKFYSVFRDQKDQRPVEEITQFLTLHKDEKFFAWVHFINPHSPYKLREGSEHLLTPGYEGVYLQNSGAHVQTYKPRRMSEKDLTRIGELYNNEVFYADQRFQRVLDVVNELDLLDKTLIIITADHGEAMVEHGVIGHHQLYQEVIRIPMVVRHPAAVGSRYIEARVSNIDLLPTLASIAGLDYVAEDIDGVNWLDGIPAVRPLLTIQMTNNAKLSMTLLNDNYKAISWCTKSEDFREELFHLVDDPGELNDVIESNEHAEAANTIFDFMHEVAGGDPCTVIDNAVAGGSMTEVDDETLEALKSLGYVQ